MHVLIDISTEDFGQNRPFLFSVTFCKQLLKNYPQVHWVFIANSLQIDSGILNGLTILECGQPSKQSSLLQYFYRRKFYKKIAGLNPQYMISPVMHLPQCFNFLLVQSHEEAYNIRQRQLKHYQYILTTSFELKQSLMGKLNLAPEQIKVLPASPRDAFQPQNDEAAIKLKDNLCGGHQFFLLNSPVISLPKLIQLLKAFSMFKKRLQSGMKLVLNFKKTKELVRLLDTYKYKNDVICIDKTDVADLALLTAAAYAVIHYTADEFFVLPQEIQCCNVPALLLQPPSFEQQPGVCVYANEMDADDIAHKLMLLYKDETYRAKIIENASRHLSNYDAAFTLTALHSLLGA